MKHIYAVILIALLLFPFPALARIGEDVTNDVIGLFGMLLTPSIFTTPGHENAGLSLYGRALTSEGEVPDFGEDLDDAEEKIDDMTIFISGRLRKAGLTLGFGQGNDFQFSQPFIMSVDYKLDFARRERSVMNAAVDFQYTMIILPEEDEIEVSAAGFGVFSINGMLSADLRILEPYVGLNLNYVYLNSERKSYQLWKPVPEFGLQIKPLPRVRVGAEVRFIDNEFLESAWMWDIGFNIKIYPRR
jgi:hypothetical protein